MGNERDTVASPCGTRTGLMHLETELTGALVQEEVVAMSAWEDCVRSAERQANPRKVPATCCSAGRPQLKRGSVR